MNDAGFRRFVFKKVERMESARSGKQRFWAGLALVGSVGWMIVIPMVGGAFLGRWLDAMAGTGLSFTLGLLMLGLGTGAYSVWRLFVRSL